MGEEQETMEGLRLGIEAIGEVLSKQNTVLEKMLKKQEDEDEEKENDEKEEEMEKAVDALVKEVSDRVTKSLIQKMDEAEATNTGADSDEKKEDISTKPGEQQDVIEAADDDNDKDKKEEKKEEDEKDKEKEEDKEYPEIEKLKKEIDSMKKSNEKSIQDEVESRLRKMGFKQENQRVIKKVDLGADDAVIKKSEDRIEELAKLDWKTLKRMEMQSETDELPPEIKSFLS